MKISAIALRNFKCYGATTVVPIFSLENNKFLGLIGENGVGKSAILQALDAFFNDKNWSRNKVSKSSEADCGVALIVSCQQIELEGVTSNIRELIVSNSDTIKANLRGKGIAELADDSVFFSCMYFKDKRLSLFDGEKTIKDREEEAKKVREIILSAFSYVYVDAEIDIDDATGVGSEMEKLIKGTGFVESIAEKLRSTVVDDGVPLVTHINEGSRPSL